jgi:NAD(P)-dependent dehydrogenase (short-subunit alcohol dehydrogenase family)
VPDTTVDRLASYAAALRFEDLPPEVFDAVVQTDVVGTSNVARAAVRHLRERGSGHLVLLGSMLGHAAMPYQAPYVMSKFAISALIRILRQENQDRPGIAVHGIYPGPVDTPIYPDSANYLGREVQVPPPADEPETVARAVVGAVTSGRSRDRSVGWANAAAVLAFRLVPRLYDALIAPGLRAAAFTKRSVPTTPGNVLQAADRSRSRPEESRLRH